MPKNPRMKTAEEDMVQRGKIQLEVGITKNSAAFKRCGNEIQERLAMRSYLPVELRRKRIFVALDKA
jgi:hypothetical protein